MAGRALFLRLHLGFAIGVENFAAEGTADDDLAGPWALVGDGHFALDRGPAILVDADADELKLAVLGVLFGLIFAFQSCACAFPATL